MKPQNWENGLLMKEVACLCGCQPGTSFGGAMLFSFPGQPWKPRLHLSRRCRCSHGGSRRRGSLCSVR